ncbi:carbonic anhydrase [Virgibacillus chiguensis]|uniref:carbonic anhydrase n=1 Tax=Virgibacillus chiguensis TaxID=411959 RepID=A0A1M5VY26_9BACI|nr:carbonic anhydrase [Virgibacillus chiguensis]SHH79904.1 carbonic anhydrase [Virgibacillus chiguensis]
MDEKNIMQSNQDFVNKMQLEDPDLFHQLQQGQHPDFFVIACSDSRVSPSVISQMKLGNMFVHRNIANQVAKNDASFSASLYYALVHLKVKHIIIKGHTECGGIHAAWSGNNEEELAPWIANIRSNLPDSSSNKEFSMDELTKINIMKQVEHIKDHLIYKAYGEGVSVSGLLFHLDSGQLEKIV